MGGRPTKTDCREFAFVEHLLSEHRRLDGLIRRTLGLFPMPDHQDSVQWLADLLGGLRSIRQELVQHFEEEEAGGCVEEAVARCPALSREAQRLASQHEHLLGELDALIGRCERMAEPDRHDRMAIEEEVRMIVRELQIHEAEESRVMERGFSVCLEQDGVSNEAYLR